MGDSLLTLTVKLRIEQLFPRLTVEARTVRCSCSAHLHVRLTEPYRLPS